MDPVTAAALITGGVALVGGYMNNQQNAQNVAEANRANREIANQTNAQNIAIAREQMNFQAAMSSTAYQRAMKDMQAAGLNPMLAYSQGGASTPMGSAIASQSARMEAAQSEEMLGKAVSSGMEMRRLQKELAATDSQVKLNDAVAATQAAQTKLNETNAKVAAKNAEILDTKMPAIKAQSKLEEKTAKYNEKAAGYDAIMNRVKQATGIVNDAASVIKPKININQKTREKETIIDKNTGEVLYEGYSKP